MLCSPRLWRGHVLPRQRFTPARLITAMLESGTMDLAIGYFPGPIDAHSGEVLFHEEFDCLYDANACGVTAPLSLATYLKLPHVVTSLCEELTTGIDAAHRSLSKDRRHTLVDATP